MICDQLCESRNDDYEKKDNFKNITVTAKSPSSSVQLFTYHFKNINYIYTPVVSLSELAPELTDTLKMYIYGWKVTNKNGSHQRTLKRVTTNTILHNH